MKQYAVLNGRTPDVPVLLAGDWGGGTVASSASCVPSPVVKQKQCNEGDALMFWLLVPLLVVFLVLAYVLGAWIAARLADWFGL